MEKLGIRSMAAVLPRVSPLSFLPQDELLFAGLYVQIFPSHPAGFCEAGIFMCWEMGWVWAAASRRDHVLHLQVPSWP